MADADVRTAVTGAVATLIAFIMSVISMFVGFLFLPLLNGSAIFNSTNATIGNTQPFLTANARTLLQDVYPVLMVLIPMFVLIAGLTTTAFLSIKK